MGATGKDTLVDDGGFDSAGYYHGPPQVLSEEQEAECDRDVLRQTEAQLCERALNMFRLAKELTLYPETIGLAKEIAERAAWLAQECADIWKKELDQHGTTR